MTMTGQASNISMLPLTDHTALLALAEPIRAYQGVVRPPPAPTLAPIRTAHRQGGRAGLTPSNTNGRRVASFQRHNAEAAADNAVAGSSSGPGSRRSGAPRPFQRTEVPVHEDRELHILCLPHSVSVFNIERFRQCPSHRRPIAYSGTYALGCAR